MTGYAGLAQLRTWIGRSEVLDDVATESPLKRLSALLDHETCPWAAGVLPPLGHWLYFLPQARQSDLDDDGHARRGGLLPPVALPRRMWAGGQVQFHSSIAIGATLKRISTVTDVTAKTGRSGAMIFVSIRHEVLADNRLAVVEHQDLVYREPQQAGNVRPQTTAAEESDVWRSRSVALDASALFRYSALTFNAHRIHYDRDYSRDVEGYDGLVVHAPFLATLLMDWFIHNAPARRIERFAFRAQRPLLDTHPFQLCLGSIARTTSLWAQDSLGARTLTATVET